MLITEICFETNKTNFKVHFYPNFYPDNTLKQLTSLYKHTSLYIKNRIKYISSLGSRIRAMVTYRVQVGSTLT